MNVHFFIDTVQLSGQDFEIVERKGKGHPDTLADRLAERLSIAYSNLTKKEAGLILRHQFDKLLLMGGRCKVGYGSGEFISPVRLVLDGRATARIGSKIIEFKDYLINECQVFLEQELQNFEFAMNCNVIFETTSNSTRGLVDNAGNFPINYRFSPRTPNDLPEFTQPLANDTALGYGFAPYTNLEALVLQAERLLTSQEIKYDFPWIGTDIKIMGCRVKDEMELTLAVPQISTKVASVEEYVHNSKKLLLALRETAATHSNIKTRIHLNPSDIPEKDVVYLRYTGSCIESGDEGVVGRGNRIGGVISACRSYSIEGLNGKNPSYHAGKVYSVMAWEIAQHVWETYGVQCEVFILSQIDRPLEDPWKIIVKSANPIDTSSVLQIISGLLSNLESLTTKILEGGYPLV
jgi:S-adenosylmethionine synthetase